MNQQLFKWLHAVSVIIFLFFIGSYSVEASEITFSVKAILPDNQRTKETSYFDLRVAPNQTQKLQIELTNQTANDITVLASANAAITNDNGLADYSHAERKKDPSAPFTFNEIAQLPKEIQLPKHSTKTVECQLILPEKPFNGYVLGGLYFEQKSDEQPAHSENGVAINNRFSYVVGVLLSETDEPVQPELSLNEVKTDQANGRNRVLMNLQNKQAAMIKKLQVDASLYYEKEAKPRYENHQESLTMAPNTNFNYRIDLKEQPFVPGNYTVKIKVNDGYQDYSWEKHLVIQEKEAKKYNATAVNLPPEKHTNFPWKLVSSITLVFLFILGSTIYYFKKKIRESQIGRAHV